LFHPGLALEAGGGGGRMGGLIVSFNQPIKNKYAPDAGAMQP
jgi:hypothetical protein